VSTVGIHIKLKQENQNMFIRQHVKTMAVSLTLCFAVTILASMKAHCAEQQAELATSELTCEYATNPLGVDTPRPRFGWRLKSEQRAQLQSAYRVLVPTAR
jgi:alpha-L-rhamnosidase